MPKDVEQLCCFSWQLGLFKSEVLTPKTTEYAKLIVAGQTRSPTMDEVDALYAQRPWHYLRRSIYPVMFDPDEKPFARVHRNARALVSRLAQALWERTHFILPADDGGGKSSRRAKFLDSRRKRNGDLAKHWVGHLEALLSAVVMAGNDPDLLLDPSWLWPPAYGVALAAPHVGESLKDCIDRLDSLEPERSYFRLPSTHRRMPVSKCFDARVMSGLDNFAFDSFDDLATSWTTRGSPGIPTAVALLDSSAARPPDDEEGGESLSSRSPASGALPQSPGGLPESSNESSDLLSRSSQPSDEPPRPPSAHSESSSQPTRPLQSFPQAPSPILPSESSGGSITSSKTMPTSLSQDTPPSESSGVAPPSGSSEV
ncbi:hypothetical protein P43SY_011653 [Pythium insidiosum]|uniref:Uncharacterized protein n=1 Tax=Pythium insidiosum TaxID=114742 RepID=A0AAD5Q157_PYTIN|nr:hypothetical protein P43SY_011653 [Pythium insidiosum]